MAIGPYKDSVSLEQILQYVFDFSERRLRVDASGVTLDAVVGDVTITPGDAFRAKTYIATASEQSIVFSGFQIKQIILKSLSENPGYIRIGGPGISAASDYYLVSPGETVNIPIQGDVAPIYFVLDTGAPAGTYRLSVLSVNG
jgi:hypothetical protein